METQRQELRKQLKLLNETIQFHDTDDLEGEEISINAKKLIVLTEESLSEILSQFVKAYIVNDVSGFYRQDGTYCIHKFRMEALEKLMNANSFTELEPAMKSLIKHEAVKMTSIFIGNTLE